MAGQCPTHKVNYPLQSVEDAFSSARFATSLEIMVVCSEMLPGPEWRGQIFAVCPAPSPAGARLLLQHPTRPHLHFLGSKTFPSDCCS